MHFGLNGYRVKDSKKAARSWGCSLEFHLVSWPQGYKELRATECLFFQCLRWLCSRAHRSHSACRKKRCRLLFILAFPSPSPASACPVGWWAGTLLEVWACQVGEYIPSRFPALGRVSPTHRLMLEMVTTLPSWRDQIWKRVIILDWKGKLVLCCLSRIENTCPELAAAPRGQDGSQGQCYFFLYRTCLYVWWEQNLGTQKFQCEQGSKQNVFKVKGLADFVLGNSKNNNN